MFKPWTEFRKVSRVMRSRDVSLYGRSDSVRESWTELATETSGANADPTNDGVLLSL